MQEQMEERSETIQNLIPQSNVLSPNLKLADFEQQDGMWVNKHFPKFSFADKEKANKWTELNIAQRKRDYKRVLSPALYYLSQEVNTEMPFSGHLWDTKDAGHYECKVCTHKVFMSEHKYDCKSGYPTFWNHIIDTVDY